MALLVIHAYNNLRTRINERLSIVDDHQPFPFFHCSAVTIQVTSFILQARRHLRSKLRQWFCFTKSSYRVEQASVKRCRKSITELIQIKLDKFWSQKKDKFNPAEVFNCIPMHIQNCTSLFCLLGRTSLSRYDPEDSQLLRSTPIKCVPEKKYTQL